MKKNEENIEIEIKEQEEEVKLIISQSKKYFKIKNKNDLIKATDISVQIKRKLKELEGERKEYTEPLNQTLKKLNNTFKELTEPLKKMEEAVKESINQYREEEERKRAEQEEKLKTSTGSKNLAVVNELPDVIEGNLGETRTVRRWSFEIEDEKKIPRDYLEVDQKKVNGAISDGIRKIPGLRIYQKITTSVYEKK